MNRSILIFLTLCCFACASIKKDINPALKKDSIEIILSNNRVSELAGNILERFLKKANISVDFVEQPSNKSYYLYVGADFQNKINQNIPTAKDAFGMKIRATFGVISGKDILFYPKEPYLTRDSNKNQFFDDWDAITENTWGNPQEYIRYHDEIVSYDDLGTVYGVYDWLERLGFRWYMPNELGEVIPKNIDFPKLADLNENQTPDCDHRTMLFYGKDYSRKAYEIEWEHSLRINRMSNYTDRLMLGHGMRNVHSRPEQRLKTNLYAVLNGVPDTDSRGFGKPCLKEEALLLEHIEYIVDYYNTYKEKVISVMPTDSYGVLCEHSYCQVMKRDGEKSGMMSNYVWEYIHKLSTAIYARDPEIKISCFAYGSYLLPPTNISSFPPNLIIGICGKFEQFEDQASIYATLISDWAKLTPNKMILWDYYNDFHDNSIRFAFPFVRSSALINNIQNTEIIGRSIEVSLGSNVKRNLAFSNFEIYLTSKLWWNKNLNKNEIIEDYFSNYFGSVGGDMRVLYEMIEGYKGEQQLILDNLEEIKTRITAALNKLNPASKQHQRVQLLSEYIAPLEVLKTKDYRKEFNSAKITIPPTRTRIENHILDGMNDEVMWRSLIKHPLNKGTAASSPKNYYQLAWANEKLLIFVSAENTTINTDDNVQIYIDALDIPEFDFVLNENGAFTFSQATTMPNYQEAIEYGFQCQDGCNFEFSIDLSKFGNSNFDSFRPKYSFPWYFNIVRNNDHKISTIFYDQNRTNEENMVKLATQG